MPCKTTQYTTVYHSIPHTTHRTPHQTLHTAHCTLHTAHRTLHTTHHTSRNTKHDDTRHTMTHDTRQTTHDTWHETHMKIWTWINTKNASVKHTWDFSADDFNDFSKLISVNLLHFLAQPSLLVIWLWCGDATLPYCWRNECMCGCVWVCSVIVWGARSCVWGVGEWLCNVTRRKLECFPYFFQACSIISFGWHIKSATVKTWAENYIYF
jgi:hypothetical protein